MASTYVDEFLVPEGTEVVGRRSIPDEIAQIGRLVLPGSVRMIEDSTFDYLTIGELVLPDGPCCLVGSYYSGLHAPVEFTIDRVVIPAGHLPCFFERGRLDSGFSEAQMAFLVDSAAYDARRGILPPSDVTDAAIRRLTAYLRWIVRDSIIVDPAHPLLRSVDGILYDKALGTLFFVPPSKRDVTLPGTLRRVAKMAVLSPPLTRLCLPEGTQILEDDSIISDHEDVTRFTVEIPWSLMQVSLVFDEMTVLFRTPYGALKIVYPDFLYRDECFDHDKNETWEYRIGLRRDAPKRRTRTRIDPIAVLHAETEDAAWAAFCQLDRLCACLTALWCCRRWPESRRFRMYLKICVPKAVTFCIEYHDTDGLRAHLAADLLTPEAFQLALDVSDGAGDTVCKAILLDYAGSHGLLPNDHRL